MPGERTILGALTTEEVNVTLENAIEEVAEEEEDGSSGEDPESMGANTMMRMASERHIGLTTRQRQIRHRKERGLFLPYPPIL